MLRPPSPGLIGGTLIAAGIALLATELASPGVILTTGAVGYNGGGAGGAGLTQPGTGVGPALWTAAFLIIVGIVLLAATRLMGRRRP